MTLQEFLLLLKLSYSAYRKLRSEGKMPPEIKLSRRTIRFSRRAVNEWLNGNGVQDTGEPGLEGVTVLLLSANGTVLQTTTTDGSGQYLFSGLPAGSYQVAFVAPAGSTYAVSPKTQGGDPTLDSDISPSGTTDTITLSAGQTRLDIDAGFYPGVAGFGGRQGCGGWGDFGAEAVGAACVG